MVVFQDFNLAAGRADLVDAPNAFNGNVGHVSTSTSAEFINQSNYYVYNDDSSQISFAYTLAYRINQSMNNPDNAVGITADDLENAKTIINRTFEWYTLMRIITACDDQLVLEYNRSDILTLATASDAANWANCVAMANILFTEYRNDASKASYLCPNTHMAAILLVVNAIHRKMVSGHNWLSDRVGMAQHASAKALNAAGEFKDQLLAYARAEHTGHDMFHFLDNRTIDDIATMLTDDTVLPANTNIGGVGQRDEDRELKELFNIPEGCVDRWPVGKAGVSAIYLGVSEITATCSTIAVVTANFPVAEVIAALDEVKAFVNHEDTERDIMLTVKESLGQIAGFACGFNGVTKEGKERLEGLISLNALVSRHSQLVAAGKALGVYYAEQRIDRDAALALAAQFSLALKTFAASVHRLAEANNAANRAEIAEATARFTAVRESNFELKRTLDERRSMAGRRADNIKTMEKLNDLHITIDEVDAMDE